MSGYATAPVSSFSLSHADSGAAKVSQLQADNELYYADTLAKLRQLNETLSGLLGVVNIFSKSVDSKLSWLLGLVGAAGAWVTSWSGSIMLGLHWDT